MGRCAAVPQCVQAAWKVFSHCDYAVNEIYIHVLDTTLSLFPTHTALNNKKQTTNAAFVLHGTARLKSTQCNFGTRYFSKFHVSLLLVHCCHSNAKWSCCNIIFNMNNRTHINIGYSFPLKSFSKKPNRGASALLRLTITWFCVVHVQDVYFT